MPCIVQMGQSRDTSQGRSGGDGGNYDHNGALDLSGGSPMGLKRKRSDSEQVGPLSSRRGSPASSGSRTATSIDNDGLHGANKRHLAAPARTPSSSL